MALSSDFSHATIGNIFTIYDLSVISFSSTTTKIKMSSPEGKINDLLVRIREENNMGSRVPPITPSPFVPPVQHPCRRPNLPRK